MKLRGPGDLLGFRQSGDLEFNLADIYQDGSILELTSRAAAQLIVSGSLNQEEYRKLKDKCEIYMKNKMEEIQL